MASPASKDEAGPDGAEMSAPSDSPSATPTEASAQPVEPAPPPPAKPRKSRNRRRRLQLIDRAIPLLAAIIGLIALAGAVMIEARTDQRTHQMATEVAELKAGMTILQQQTAAIAKAQDNGTVEGLLALQDRIAKLEAAAKAAPPVAPTAPVVGATAPAGDATSADGTPAPLTDPTATASASSSPAPGAQGGDCIPVGLRFMAVPNQNYALCQSNMVIKVGEIGDGTVDIAGTGTVAASGFGTIPDTKCTVMVFSAVIAGFAELRVSCS